MKDNRIEYLDMAKGIGIILVVLGHITYTNIYLQVWISSFHMALFFVISGLFISLGSGNGTRTFKDELKRRYRGIVIPYMWFSLLYFLVDIGNLLLHKITQEMFIYNLISSVTFYGKSVMWFLTALFIGQMALHIVRLICRDKMVYIILMTVVLTFFAYMCKLGLDTLGATYAESLFISSLLRILRSLVRGIIILPFLTTGLVLGPVIYGKNSNRAVNLLIGLVLLGVNIWVALTNWSVDTNNMILSNPFLYYLGGITGSLAIIYICKALPVSRIITYYGRNSLTAMATHLELYILWAGVTCGKLVSRLISGDVVIVIVATVVTLALDVICIELINRYCPFVLGKRRIRE